MNPEIEREIRKERLRKQLINFRRGRLESAIIRAYCAGFYRRPLIEELFGFQKKERRY